MLMQRIVKSFYLSFHTGKRLWRKILSFHLEKPFAHKFSSYKGAFSSFHEMEVQYALTIHTDPDFSLNNTAFRFSRLSVVVKYALLFLLV